MLKDTLLHKENIYAKNIKKETEVKKKSFLQKIFGWLKW